MRATLKAVNDQLEALGYEARLKKGDEYFYFSSGETANWLNNTVRVPTLSSLTVDQWVDEFKKLKDLNQRLSGGVSKRLEKKRSNSPRR